MNKNYWKKVWERKGKINTDNFIELDGFEATIINPKLVASKIIKLLDIKKNRQSLGSWLRGGNVSAVFEMQLYRS